MIIILEGPDGAGKSTLVESFRRNSNRYFWTLRSSGPPASVRQLLEVLGWATHKPSDIDILFDRHPSISESIYGPILRDVNLLKDYPQDLWLLHSNAIVYCRPPFDVIEHNVKHTPQLSGVQGCLMQIVRMYDVLMESLSDSNRIIHYDYTKHRVEDIIAQAWSNSDEPEHDRKPDGAPTRSSTEVLIDRVEKSVRDESFDPS